MLYIHGNLVEYCHDRYADQHKKNFLLSNIAVILRLMSIAFYKSCIHCLPERKEPYKKHLQQKMFCHRCRFRFNIIRMFIY